jgi:hypothetical protein
VVVVVVLLEADAAAATATTATAAATMPVVTPPAAAPVAPEAPDCWAAGACASAVAAMNMDENRTAKIFFIFRLLVNVVLFVLLMASLILALQ